MKNLSCVWYASYGSNLCRDRFLCYIKGGKPEGSAKSEIGCRDKSLPKDDKPIEIPFPLYFAMYSKKWGGGVAFIGLKKDGKEITLGRRYLITEEQFSDVVSQENYDTRIYVDFKRIKKQGSAVLSNSWYGNIIYLGDREGSPVFTFTASWDITNKPFVAPSADYLKMLALGLKESYCLSKNKIIEYLIKKEGVKKNFTEEMLLELL